MSPIYFHTALGDPSCAFGAALLQGPTHRADSLSFPFIPPRGSILRLWRPLLQRPTHGAEFSLFLSFRLEDPSCAFGAALLQGTYSWSGFTLFSFHSASRIHPALLAQPFSKGLLMERIHSLFLSFRLEDPSCAFGAALLQGPTHGADSLSFPFIPPRGSILRLWRGPSPRAYSWSRFTLFSFHSASRIHPAPLARPFSKGLLMERIHSLFLSFRLEDPSCAFGAPLLQGATQLAKLLSFT